MKLVCHLVILLFSFCAFTSRLQAQENDKSAGAGLSIRATAKPVSIIALSTNPTNAELSVTNLNAVGIVRLSLRNPENADIVRQTADGTVFLNRIEIFVRFSGYQQETATVQITLNSLDDSTKGPSVQEGASPEASQRLLPKRVIEVQGVKSGERIVRYVGFLVSDDIGVAVAGRTSLEASVKYEIAHP